MTTNEIKINDYLNIIRDNMKFMEERFNKNFNLLVLLLAVYFLVSMSLVSKLSFFNIEINDLSIIHKSLPLIIVFYFRELCAITYMRKETRNKHKELITRTNIDSFSEYFMNPASSLIASEVISEEYNSISSKFLKYIDNFSDAVLMLIICLIQPYIIIYIHLSKHEHSFFVITIAIFSLVIWLSGTVILSHALRCKSIVR